MCAVVSSCLTVLSIGLAAVTNPCVSLALPKFSKLVVKNNSIKKKKKNNVI